MIEKKEEQRPQPGKLWKIALIFAVLLVPAVAQTRKSAPKQGTPGPVTSKANFKESGSPNALVTIELYTDYECPVCREFYLNTLPRLISDFVNTGKVRLIHRDYPLTQHHFSKLATRYANAAGKIGKYDVAGRQLFETQAEWAVNGDIDSALAKVFSASEMAKLKDLVQNDSTLDDTMVKDQDAGTFQDHVQQTPTIVFVHKGKRETVGGNMSYDLLKDYLNKMLLE